MRVCSVAPQNPSRSRLSKIEGRCQPVGVRPPRRRRSPNRGHNPRLRPEESETKEIAGLSRLSRTSVTHISLPQSATVVVDRRAHARSRVRFDRRFAIRIGGRDACYCSAACFCVPVLRRHNRTGSDQHQCCLSTRFRVARTSVCRRQSAKKFSKEPTNMSNTKSSVYLCTRQARKFLDDQMNATMAPATQPMNLQRLVIVAMVHV